MDKMTTKLKCQRLWILRTHQNSPYLLCQSKKLGYQSLLMKNIKRRYNWECLRRISITVHMRVFRLKTLKERMLIPRRMIALERRLVRSISKVISKMKNSNLRQCSMITMPPIRISSRRTRIQKQSMGHSRVREAAHSGLTVDTPLRRSITQVTITMLLVECVSLHSLTWEVAHPTGVKEAMCFSTERCLIRESINSNSLLSFSMGIDLK